MLRNGSGSDTARNEAAKLARPEPAGMTAFGQDSPAPYNLGPDNLGPDNLGPDREMCSLIQQEIIPRLVAAHRFDDPVLPRIELGSVGMARLDPEAVADQALDNDASGLMLMFEAAIARGAGIEDLLIDVLAPAARCLGTRWEQDSADFIDVTMGLWRLQEVVHELTRRDGAAAHKEQRARSERNILCAVAPGDDHSFGSVILEEFFRRAGWNASSCRATTRSDLLATIVSQWFDVVALTVTVEQPSGSLAKLVAAIRATSRNPAVGVMVGGRIFSEQPGLADEVGADATASDARGALSKAEQLVGQLQGPDRLPSMAGALPGRQPQRRGVVPG